jgi:lipopolysaccharide transport system permease protein
MTQRSELHLTVHTADMRLRQPGDLLFNLGRDVVRSRYIAWEMMKRDLINQYRTSVLGALIPLLPALTTAAWAILFRDAHIINVASVSMPYPFFVLCGMMLWAAFLESIDAPISGVQAEQSLLSKADVPPEAVTVSRVGHVLVNFCVKAIVVAAAALAYRVRISWTILMAPFGLLMIVALGTAIGLILAPINLLYKDVSKALPVITTFWFFATPIIFTSPNQGWVAMVMNRLNPMTPLLNTTRELAFGGGLSMVTGLEVSVVLTLCLFIVAALFHRIAMPIVIDRANA